jgi:ATP-dependent Clp protease ATP-binding subunit ClpA
VLERFTDRARRVLTLAKEEARLLNHSFIGTEHILLGVIGEGEGVGAQALRSLGVSQSDVRHKVQDIVGMSSGPPTESPPFTPRAKKVLELSLREAHQLGHHHIGTEHILLGLVREGEGVAAAVLVGLGAGLSRVRQEVITIISGGQLVPDDELADDTQAIQTGPASPREPCCPSCRSTLSAAARFRNIVVPSDTHDTDPLSIAVVYCLQCGTTLNLFKA